MQNLQLSDSEDLNVYKDKLENLNLQLSWVGQGMPEPYLIHLAQHQLKKIKIWQRYRGSSNFEHCFGNFFSFSSGFL